MYIHIGHCKKIHMIIIQWVSSTWLVHSSSNLDVTPAWLGKYQKRNVFFCILSKTAKKEMLLHLYIYLFIITDSKLFDFLDEINVCPKPFWPRHEKDNQNPEHMTSTSRGPIVCKIHREIGGTLAMVALIINPIYT